MMLYDRVIESQSLQVGHCQRRDIDFKILFAGD